MTKDYNPDDPNELAIIRFLNGRMSLDEIDALNKWIEASPENRELFQYCQNIWIGSSTAFPDEKFNPQKGWGKLRSGMQEHTYRQIYNSRHRTRRIYTRIARIAALFLVIFSLGALLSWLILMQPHSLSEAQISEISTPQGSRSRLVLPDNSVVWLNAGSTVTYNSNFNLAERTVQLEGEAYFDITTNPGKPFIVKTSHLNIRALGTEFNVKAYPDEDAILTTLVDGEVIIEIPDRDNRIYTYNLEPRQNFTFLKSIMSESMSEVPDAAVEEEERIPEERAELPLPVKPKAKVYVRSNIRPELYTSWKDDIWIIEGETLADIAVMLGRRFNTKINIESEELYRYRFTGKIMNETLEQVLEILRLTTPLKYSVGKGIVDWKLDPELKDKFDEILDKRRS